MSIVEQILKLSMNRYLIPIPPSFVLDDFNLVGLEEHPGLEECVGLLPNLLACFEDMADTDSDYSDREQSTDGKLLNDVLMKKYVYLYSALQQRYVLSKQGMQDVLKLWQSGFFGPCPRLYCNKTNLLPVGPVARVGSTHPLHGWCPRCKDLYRLTGRGSSIDGACYGPTVAAMMALTVPSIREVYEAPADLQVYEPRIYGFRLARH